MLIRTSAPTGGTIFLREAKQDLNVLQDDDDEKLTRLLAGEIQRYEDFTGRIMSETDFEYRVDGFCDPIRLPVVPVREVTEVTYIDEDGATQTLSGSDWYVARDAGLWCVSFADDFSAPRLADQLGAVRVSFSAGYNEPGAADSPVDAELIRNERDVTNILKLLQRVYDGEDEMTSQQMRDLMGRRRILL